MELIQPNRRVAGIMLAAGRSRRFGSDKRESRLPDGTTLLVQSARNAASSLAHLIVVLRGDEAADTEQVRTMIARPGVETICAADSDLGMGHSLAAGAAHLRKAETAYRGCVVLLADMPFLQPASISVVAASLAVAAAPVIVQPVRDGKPGHPVGFHRHFFGALTELSGEEGARSVVKANRASVQTVPLTDPGIHRDVDQPGDLKEI
jgi:molybdenum cofactor cytidylyltransferase